MPDSALPYAKEGLDAKLKVVTNPYLLPVTKRLQEYMKNKKTMILLFIILQNKLIRRTSIK